MKHHHHPTSFDTPDKDTFKLSAAGTGLVVGVSSAQVATFRQVETAADMGGCRRGDS